jgi:hypothetical protein
MKPHPSPSPSTSRSEFHRYPFLTPSEFTDAAHHLDRRYCQATLGPVRRQWRLRMCTALNTTAAYTLGPEYRSYVLIARPLVGELDDGGLAGVLGGFSFGEDGEDGDREMVEAEEGDQVGFFFAGSNVLLLWLVNSYGGVCKQRRSCPRTTRGWIRLGLAAATSDMKSTSIRPTRRRACGSAYTICQPMSSR